MSAGDLDANGQPPVSIIIPTYSYGALTGETLSRLRRQTLAEWECLVADDGSTDRGAEMVNSYSDPGIRFLVNGSNLDLMLSLYRGINAARGEYIARMDCDDVSLPKHLAKQVAFMDARPGLAASVQTVSNKGASEEQGDALVR